MKNKKMKLIVVSNSSMMENEAKILINLFEMGLETLHLRKPRLSTKKTKDLLKSIPEKYHNRIVLHSHHNLARKFNVKGIHLTKVHKKKKFKTKFNIWLIRTKRPNITISTSYSTIGDILELHFDYNYSYVFLSPIFDSLTSRFQGGFTEFSLKSALAKSKLKIIARGGVDFNAIEKAKEIGFAGVALNSNLWKAKNPIDEFNKMAEKFQELHIPIE